MPIGELVAAVLPGGWHHHGFGAGKQTGQLGVA